MDFNREPTITITTEEYRNLIAADIFRKVVVNAFLTRKYDSDLADIINAFLDAEESKDA